MTAIHAHVPGGGMCNRLISLLSRIKLANSLGVPLVFGWPKTPECPAYFAELFLPLEGVTIVDDRLPRGAATNYRPHPRHPPDFSILRPVPEIQDKIDAAIDILPGRTLAIHSRGTDFTAHFMKKVPAKGYLEPERFHPLIGALSPDIIFLATDDSAHRAHLVSSYPDRVVTYSSLDQPGFRHSTMQDAVIDLFVCASARWFAGTMHSSFTDAIHLLRESAPLDGASRGGSGPPAPEEAEVGGTKKDAS
jgi:hypothetical protein